MHPGRISRHTGVDQPLTILLHLTLRCDLLFQRRDRLGRVDGDAKFELGRALDGSDRQPPADLTRQYPSTIGT